MGLSWLFLRARSCGAFIHCRLCLLSRGPAFSSGFFRPTAPGRPPRCGTGRKLQGYGVRSSQVEGDVAGNVESIRILVIELRALVEGVRACFLGHFERSETV